MADEFCLKMPDFHVTFKDLLHAVNLRYGTNGFTSLPKEGVLRIFSLWKIQRLRLGLNPRTWVPKASTLPLDRWSRFSRYGNKCIIILEDLYLGLKYGLCARDLRQPSYYLMDRNILDCVIVGGRTWEFGLKWWNIFVSERKILSKESYKAYLTNLQGRTKRRCSGVVTQGTDL